MSIADLFRPKWKHSDPDVRCEAVEKLTDQPRLAGIAAHDSHWLVRIAAAARLSDTEEAQTAYLDIAKHTQDSRGRRKAVEFLADQSVLAGIARNDADHTVRYEAVGKLVDQSVLAEIARNDPWHNVRIIAVRKLTDQSVLAEIAKNDPDYSVRTNAINELTDQSVLFEIAKNDPDYSVRFAAAAKLSDTEGAQAVYLDMAKNERNSAGRKSALERLTDQSVLADFVLDKDASVAYAAMDRLTDQNVLARVAINDIGGVFGRDSLRKIRDRSLLVQVARDGVNPEVRLTAAGVLAGLDWYPSSSLDRSLEVLKEYLKAGLDETRKVSSSLSAARLIETALCAFTNKSGYRCASADAAIAFRDEARGIAMNICDLVDPAFVTEPDLHNKFCQLKLLNIEYRIFTRFVIDVPAVTSTWISRGDYGGPAGQVNEEEIEPAKGHEEPDGYIVEVIFSKLPTKGIGLKETTSAAQQNDDQSSSYSIDENSGDNDPCKDCRATTEFACIGCAGNR